MQLSVFPNLADPKLSITPPTNGVATDPLAALGVDPGAGSASADSKSAAFATIFGGLIAPDVLARPAPPEVVPGSPSPVSPLLASGLRTDFSFAPPTEGKVSLADKKASPTDELDSLVDKEISDPDIASDKTEADETLPKPSSDLDKDRPVDFTPGAPCAPVAPVVIPEMVQFVPHLPVGLAGANTGDPARNSAQELESASQIVGRAPGSDDLPRVAGPDAPAQAAFGPRMNRAPSRPGNSRALNTTVDVDAAQPRNDAAPLPARGVLPEVSQAAAVAVDPRKPVAGFANRETNFREPAETVPTSEADKLPETLKTESTAPTPVPVRVDGVARQSELLDLAVAGTSPVAEGRPTDLSGRDAWGDKSKREIAAAGNGTSARPERAAKFAESSSRTFSKEPSVGQSGFKKTLGIEVEPVTKHDGSLGTAVAKPEVTMSAASSSYRETSAPAARVAGVMGSQGAVAEQATPVIAAAAGGAAQKAVETVLSLTERFASSDKHSVNLQFSIGGSDLQVRVELRADQVHTAFRTESPDLRAALVHEWQAVSPTTADRPIRFADPVFTTAAGGEHGAAFSSDTSSQQQRESAARREATSGLPDFSRAPKPAAPPAVVTSAAPLRTSDRTGAQLRLSTFA